MKLKRKEDQIVGISILLRRGDKIIKRSKGKEGFESKRRVEGENERKNQVREEMREM